MAVSAFKSSSRRSNPTGVASTSSSSSSSSSANTSSTNKANPTPIRRSRSVSAFSRTATVDSQNNTFSNRRDNPLFWSSSDSPTSVDPLVKPDKEATSSSAVDARRGRSVSRNADVLVGRSQSRVDPGRSLSRVDTGRRNRSVSRCPGPRGRSVISKSEDEQECTSSSLKYKGEKGEKGGLVRTSSDELDQLKGLKTWSSQHSPFQPSSHANLTVQALHLEDDTTSSNIYETVRSEVRRAISEIQNDLESAMRRGSTPTLSASDISDIPPDLVNPSAVELVLDIRREYAKKLEQSKERARKLQSDLAVEEHRGQELSRILKEVLPDPKISNAPKSRPGRKASIERRKMSKRLTEEALAYFDECVSLSTFDSSDFSSPEDPPFNLIGAITPVDKSVSLLQESSSASLMNSSNRSLNEKQMLSIQSQFINSHNPSGLMASSVPGDPTLYQISPNSANRGKDWKFSFAHKPTETLELQQDIKKYIRHFERDDMELQSVRSISRDLGEYSLQAAAESYIFDRALFGNRIESHGITLCGGGTSSSFSPFASFF
ncbi:uncharacterized protein LOC126801583 isoform X2 [Argentina anserina]|uniref:uncharacterized protein LOC126801583 isoform X2 n=1 Tax=Argentina anserina TaxID=57926 RepID=UPI0021768A4D|nr:uncharacterized protein LOC126801583 isoform X2 [Potentilla anserina]